ncbi:hypothetical protein EU803_07590 [Loktanella sp. IMCC34160]|uniref:hypothetical protein n=1 Tax=Loktanella sp. IMCC34160 TaxID=2510646 RepID=UPI00101CD84D|nr:hypothetical protein [Loktanella sp. IMCC34160]RYG92287.1 hypothetical protein EU803_07590 [Loktanella sp. IMCC34160]
MCDLPSWFFALPDWVRAFMFSDFCGGNPDLASWLTSLFAHIGVWAVVGLFPRRLALAAFAAWIGKEVFADIPIGDWSLVVMADSLVDLAAGWFGWKLPCRRLPPSAQLSQKGYAQALPVLQSGNDSTGPRKDET